MGIFGIARKGFGMLGKARAKKKMLSGTSTRAERLKFGKRDKDIKSVPVSRHVKKGDITESVRKGKQHFYLKNINEINIHQEAVKNGKEAKKKIQHMKDTKRAFKIRKKKTFPSDPDKGSKEWGQQ